MKVDKRRGLGIEPWDCGQNWEDEEEAKEIEEG